MKEISAQSTLVLSLRDSPAHPASSLLAQKWTRQQLALNKAVHVWFLQNAVYHALQPEIETGRADDIYSGWKDLATSGIKLFLCQSACQRRLPAGSIDETLFIRAGLMTWADQILRQAPGRQNEMLCIVENDPASSRFSTESIDPVQALLALDARVKVIFTARASGHLLETACWRKWRRLPETEEQVELLAITSDLAADQQVIVSSRPSVTGITARQFQQICKRGRVLYV